MKGKNMALVGETGEGLAGPREVGMMLWQHKEGLPNRELEIQKVSRRK